MLPTQLFHATGQGFRVILEFLLSKLPRAEWELRNLPHRLPLEASVSLLPVGLSESRQAMSQSNNALHRVGEEILPVWFI
jgi:hypothetical protein